MVFGRISVDGQRQLALAAFHHGGSRRAHHERRQLVNVQHLDLVGGRRYRLVTPGCQRVHVHRSLQIVVVVHPVAVGWRQVNGTEALLLAGVPLRSPFNVTAAVFSEILAALTVTPDRSSISNRTSSGSWFWPETL